MASLEGFWALEALIWGTRHQILGAEIPRECPGVPGVPGTVLRKPHSVCSHNRAKQPLDLSVFAILGVVSASREMTRRIRGGTVTKNLPSQLTRCRRDPADRASRETSGTFVPPIEVL